MLGLWLSLSEKQKQKTNKKEKDVLEVYSWMQSTLPTASDEVIQFEHFLICRPALHFSSGLLPFPPMVHRPAPQASLVSSTSAVGVSGSERGVSLCVRGL